MDCYLRKGVVLAIVLLPLASCGSMADGRYQGKVLMRVNGSITSAETNLPSLGVALVWRVSPNLEGCTSVADSTSRVTTEGTFPAAFDLVITQPPPATAFTNDSPVAEADVAALDDQDRVYGYAANAGNVVYKVVFSKMAIVSGSAESVPLGGTALRAGYQLATWDLSGSTPALRVADVGESINIEVMATPGHSLQPVCQPTAPPTGSTPTPPSSPN